MLTQNGGDCKRNIQLKSPMLNASIQPWGILTALCVSISNDSEYTYSQCIQLTHTSSVHQHTITGIILIIQIILCMQYQIIVNYKRLLLICHGIVHQFIDGCQFLIHCIKNLFGFFRCSECIGNSQTCIVCITIPGNDSIIRITRKIRRIA